MKKLASTAPHTNKRVGPKRRIKAGITNAPMR